MTDAESKKPEKIPRITESKDKSITLETQKTTMIISPHPPNSTITPTDLSEAAKLQMRIDSALALANHGFADRPKKE